MSQQIKFLTMKKRKGQSVDAQKIAWQNLMLLFVEFGKMKEKRLRFIVNRKNKTDCVIK